jgi:hypothetical protein
MPELVAPVQPAALNRKTTTHNFKNNANANSKNNAALNITIT